MIDIAVGRGRGMKASRATSPLRSLGRHSLFILSTITVNFAVSFSSQAGTLLVYNLNESGVGSLRQAINDNNGMGGGNTIVFSNSVQGTIYLQRQLLITKDVTIV